MHNADMDLLTCFLSGYIYVCVCVCVYVCRYICVCVYVCVYIYIYASYIFSRLSMLAWAPTLLVLLKHTLRTHKWVQDVIGLKMAMLVSTLDVTRQKELELKLEAAKVNLLR